MPCNGISFPSRYIPNSPPSVAPSVAPSVYSLLQSNNLRGRSKEFSELEIAVGGDEWDHGGRDEGALAQRRGLRRSGAGLGASRMTWGIEDDLGRTSGGREPGDEYPRLSERKSERWGNNLAVSALITSHTKFVCVCLH